MERVLRYSQWLLIRACLGLGVLSAAIGCHSACKDGTCKKHGHDGLLGLGICPNLNIDNCSDIPAGAIPQPIGTFTNDYLARQAAKAEADDFVFYYNEFVDEQATLNQYGADHIARVAARLPATPALVIIQPEPNHPLLTSLRQTTVVNALTAHGITDAARRVVVGRPRAEGLFGEEAERIYPQLINGGFGGGGFGGGGFGGGGFGGGFGGFSGLGFGGF